MLVWSIKIAKSVSWFPEITFAAKSYIGWTLVFPHLVSGTPIVAEYVGYILHVESNPIVIKFHSSCNVETVL